MKLESSGSAEFERWRRNIIKYSKSIEDLKSRLAHQGEINIRNAFFKRGFKSRFAGDTVKIRSKIIDDGVTFISDTIYSENLEKGVRRHVMRYLLKAKKPIPIKDGKELIFRVCTPQSIARGNWVHKGIKKDRHVNDGMGFMEAGIDKTVRDASTEIEALKKKIQS